MSLSVSFNPASISDDERGILLNMLQPSGVQRVFEGSASALLKTTVTNPELAAPIGPSVDTLISLGHLQKRPSLEAADNPETGATSAAEAFGVVTLPTETTAAQAFANLGKAIGAAYSEVNTLPATQTLDVTVQATQPDGIEIDSEGLPYDSRIHSSSREKIKNGTWKIKRGTGETFINQVKAELRGAMSAPGVPATPVAPVVAWPFPTPNAAPAASTVPPPPPVIAPQAAPTPLTFPDLAKAVALGVTSGKITEAKVHEICGQSGIQAFHLLPTRPDLLPSVAANIMAAINV